MNTLWQSEELTELEVPAIPPRCQYGDLWALGEHRLLCGDSTTTQDVARLFDCEQFSLCFTSPPYSNQRTYKIGEFDWHSMMCGAFDQMIVNGKPDCHILVNLGLKHENRQVDMYWSDWLAHCAQIDWQLFGWYVWDKGEGLQGEWGGKLAPAHEFIFHFNQERNCPNKWIRTKEASQHKRTNKKAFRDPNGIVHKATSLEKIGQLFKVPDSVIRVNREKVRDIHTANHPAVFPVALPEFILKTWSQPGDIVYEPFSGSGTSIIAAERLHMRCYACDIEPTYIDLALERWHRLTGKQPVLISRTQPDTVSVAS